MTDSVSHRLKALQDLWTGEAGDACSLFSGSSDERCETCDEWYVRHVIRKHADALTPLIASVGRGSLCATCGHPEDSHNKGGFHECYHDLGRGLCQCQGFKSVEGRG